MPGSGKSTVGRGLAAELGFSFVDSDAEIERRTGVPIATIFEIEGEEGFRAREAEVIRDLAAQPRQVLSTGGGAVLREANRHALRAGSTVVYLKAGLDDLVARTGRDSRRPLLAKAADPRLRLAELLAAREPLYLEVADIVVTTGRPSSRTVVAAILQRLATLERRR